MWRSHADTVDTLVDSELRSGNAWELVAIQWCHHLAAPPLPANYMVVCHHALCCQTEGEADTGHRSAARLPCCASTGLPAHSPPCMRFVSFLPTQHYTTPPTHQHTHQLCETTTTPTHYSMNSQPGHQSVPAQEQSCQHTQDRFSQP